LKRSIGPISASSFAAVIAAQPGTSSSAGAASLVRLFELLVELADRAVELPDDRDAAAANPGPVNPEDDRRLSVNPEVEVERTADVRESDATRDAVDQGRDGRVIWAGSRSEPARQGRGRGRSFDSGHDNGPSAYAPRVCEPVERLVAPVFRSAP
jgi:hypothetical protein